MLLLVLVLIVYGICNIIIFGKIFNWFRKLTKMMSENIYDFFTCMMCLSFWVGIAVVELYNHFEHQGFIISNNHYFNLFLCGSLFSATTWLIHTIQEYFEDHPSNRD